MSADFYEREVELTYSGQPRRLHLKSTGGKDVVLTERELSEIRPDVQIPERLSERVGVTVRLYAQTPINAAGLSERLEADDPIVRDRARAELAKAGPQAIPYIDQILADPASSYRLRLGAVMALNKMAVKGDRLSPASNCTVAKLTGNKDPAIQRQAEQYVSAHPQMKLLRGCNRR